MLFYFEVSGNPSISLYNNNLMKMSLSFVALQLKNQRVSEDAYEIKKYWKCCEDGLGTKKLLRLNITTHRLRLLLFNTCPFSIYNNNLMNMTSSFVALQLKNQRVSEDAYEIKKYWKCCEDGLGTKKKVSYQRHSRWLFASIL